MSAVQSFTGSIAGIGTTSGLRVVIGMWDRSPFGSFCDAMVEDAQGHRTLVAPSDQVAGYVASTYSFDEVVVTPVSLHREEAWVLRSAPLRVSFVPGGRWWVTPLLASVPKVLRRRAGWARFCDPIASRVMAGVHTYGTAGGHRDEWYAATHVRSIDSAEVTWRGADAGTLAPVTPPVRFGFASAPARPSLTSLTSYVRDLD